MVRCSFCKLIIKGRIAWVDNKTYCQKHEWNGKEKLKEKLAKNQKTGAKI